MLTTIDTVITISGIFRMVVNAGPLLTSGVGFRCELLHIHLMKVYYACHGMLDTPEA